MTKREQGKEQDKEQDKECVCEPDVVNDLKKSGLVNGRNIPGWLWDSKLDTGNEVLQSNCSCKKESKSVNILD